MAELPRPDYENILSYFPYEIMRGSQEQILLKFKEYLLDPEVEYIICQAATGTGKSALALAAARSSKSAYVATANKLLQDQYVRDFDELMVNLKGRANYECRMHQADPGKPKFNCANSPCRSDKDARKLCSTKNMCEYHEVRDKASEAKITSFNFASALPYLNYLSHLFPPRNLMVCDEAHSVWQWITGFIAVDLNLKMLQDLNILERLPNYEKIDHYLVLVGRIQIAVKDYLSLPNLRPDLVEKLETFANRLKLFDIITDNKTKVDNFIIDKKFDVKDPTKVLNISFKPVEVSGLLKEYFFKFAKKTVLLSAVILDFETYMDLMGIDPAKCRVLSVESTFPVKNRPINTYEAVGKFNRSNLNSYLPYICLKIDDLLWVYRGVKGIIHGVSWDLCRKIYAGVSEKTRRRLLFAGDEDTSSDQTELLKQHAESKEPTVLLSPSMVEGVDLKDDLSRIQIIVKVPYPSLGDPLIVKRMKLRANFYPMLTAQAIVQMYGRSIRSETDVCDTFVLDGGFLRFIENNLSMFPPSFIKAIARKEVT